MKQVFIIHGWTYNLDKWSKISQELKNRDIEPVFLRVPGLTEPSDKVWDINVYVSWLDEQLKNVSKPIVIGHSNGGRIAMAYINAHPDKISRLILIDSAGIAHNHSLAKAKLKTLKYLSKVGKGLKRVPPVKKAFYKVIGAQDYNNASPNMRLTMRNMLAADEKIDFSSIKLPVVIIWGRQDTITPLKDGQKLHQLISNSKLHIIDEAKHAPFYNQADKVADIIIETVNG